MRTFISAVDWFYTLPAVITVHLVRSAQPLPCRSDRTPARSAQPIDTTYRNALGNSYCSHCLSAVLGAVGLFLFIYLCARLTIAPALLYI